MIACVVAHKTLLKIRLPRLYSCPWQYGSVASFGEFDTGGSESCRFVWNNAKWRPMGHSTSLRVIDFSIDRKPACDLRLVNTAYSYHAPFPSYRGLLKLSLSTGVFLLNSIVWTESLTAEFALKNRNIALSHGAQNSLIHRTAAVDHQCDRRTDGRTDRRNYDSNSVRLTTRSETYHFTEVHNITTYDWIVQTYVFDFEIWIDCLLIFACPRLWRCESFSDTYNVRQGIRRHQTPPRYRNAASGSRLKVQPSTHRHTAHYDQT